MDMFAMAALYEGLIGIRFRVGPEIPDMPDRVGIVTALPGLGLINDGLFDQPQFSVQIRGGQNQYSDVEGYAKQVDDLIIFGDYPHELWGSYVITAYRAGGAPAPQPLDMGRRIIFACTYIAHEATDL